MACLQGEDDENADNSPNKGKGASATLGINEGGAIEGAWAI